MKSMDMKLPVLPHNIFLSLLSIESTILALKLKRTKPRYTLQLVSYRDCARQTSFVSNQGSLCL